MLKDNKRKDKLLTFSPNGANATSAPSEALQPVPQKRNTGKKRNRKTKPPTGKEFTPPHKEKEKEIPPTRGRNHPKRKMLTHRNTKERQRGKEDRHPCQGSNAHRTGGAGQGGKEGTRQGGNEANRLL